MPLNVTPGSGATIDTLSDITRDAGPSGNGSLRVAVAGGHAPLITISPSIPSATPTIGNVLAATELVANAMRYVDGTGYLDSLMVIDGDDVSPAFDLYLLDANVAVGSESSAPSISDANAANILGMVSVAAADYKDLIGVRVANIKNIGIHCKAASGSRDVYMAIVAQSASALNNGKLILRLGFAAD